MDVNKPTISQRESGLELLGTPIMSNRASSSIAAFASSSVANGFSILPRFSRRLA